MTKTQSNTRNGHTSTVLSRDGAAIGYISLGSGPSVVVIPGALSVASGYTAFASCLANHFSVHIMERRGRGPSSPQGDAYSIDKEVDDVLALCHETGASFLVGHSFGGLIALEAARRNPALDKIAVYEPGVSIAHSIPMSWMRGYEEKLARKQYYDAFVEFSLATGPDRTRNFPVWLMKLLLPLYLSPKERQLMLGQLAENLREHREIARLDSSYRNYREISAGVLLLHGGKSGLGWVRLAIEQLASILPHSQTKIFPRLNHFGIDKQAPEEVARTIGDYFSDASDHDTVARASLNWDPLIHCEGLRPAIPRWRDGRATGRRGVR
ncbi:MAG: alpha/beta hydrolase [Bryobacteraceae bacterium]|jgi:pimeloyl-ACP methyl ester carboxylesterase